MAASTMLSRASYLGTVAGVPSLKLKPNVNTAFLGVRRNVVVYAKQTDDTPLPGTKVDPEEKEDPLRIFGGSPVEKFFRPEEERRPEDGNTSPDSLMKFDGPAPETINSRLAMLGITWAFVAEIITGQSVWEQVTEGRGLIWFLFVAPIIIGATLIPMFNRESPDSRANGPFNAQNERWNGRAAMIGLVALLVTENIYLKGPLLGFVHSSLNL
uniref:Early light-inducible protein ELIPA n=1 Tax=Syntrichia ruralis TaxID=38588 RepID=Q8RYB6_SYNRU|nr:early light-inducible protein ELIPA [Syntrichia ruralis]